MMRLNHRRTLKRLGRSGEETLSRIMVGNAPVSWGVWFSDDPKQVGWGTFLDDVEGAGNAVVEQDMCPAPADRPFPVAKATREHLHSLEIS